VGNSVTSAGFRYHDTSPDGPAPGLDRKPIRDFVDAWLAQWFVLEFNAWGPKGEVYTKLPVHIFSILNSEICCKWFLSHFEFELKHH